MEKFLAHMKHFREQEEREDEILDHDFMMKVCRETEEKCKQTYNSIKAKLDKLGQLSESTAALRRLIKRN